MINALIDNGSHPIDPYITFGIMGGLFVFLLGFWMGRFWRR